MILLRYAQQILMIDKFRNISRAAEALYTTQSALSRNLAAVEQELDIRLFNRNVTPLYPTEAGEIYLDYLRQIITLEQKMRTDIEETRFTYIDSIAVGLVPQRAIDMLTKVIPTFTTTNPQINVITTCNMSRDLELQFFDNKLDICLLNSPMQRPHHYAVELMREKVMFVTNVNHPMCRGYDLTTNSSDNPIHIAPRDLQDEVVIYLDERHRIGKISEDILQQFMIRPENTLKVFNLTNAVHLASTGAGISIVPEYILNGSDISSNLAYFTLAKPPFTWSLFMLYRKNMSTHQQEFCKNVINYYSKHPKFPDGSTPNRMLQTSIHP